MLKSTIEYDKEDLKVLIDDKKLDISVLDYIEIENKYDWYLRAIRFFGNFATFEHIAAILKVKHSRTKVFKDLNSMCELYLLRKEELGNYIYFILTKKAQIYLKKRNNVGYIPNPSDKAVKSNLLLGDYLLNNKLNLTIGDRKSHKSEIIGLIYNFTDYEEYIRTCYMYLYREMAGVKEIEKDFFVEQVNLIKKKSEFIESNGKLRLVKYYDVLSKLMLKNIYLLGVGSKDYSVTITFLIQDIGRSVSWYKKEIIGISNILRKFYFNPIEKCIKYNLIIQTDSIDNKNNLVKVQKLFSDLKKQREKSIEYALRPISAERRFIGSYLRHRGDLPWGLNNISIVEYNTVRFFETKSDKINTIDHKQINIVDFS